MVVTEIVGYYSNELVAPAKTVVLALIVAGLEVDPVPVVETAVVTVTVFDLRAWNRLVVKVGGWYSGHSMRHEIPD